MEIQAFVFQWFGSFLLITTAVAVVTLIGLSIITRIASIFQE